MWRLFPNRQSGTGSAGWVIDMESFHERAAGPTGEEARKAAGGAAPSKPGNDASMPDLQMEATPQPDLAVPPVGMPDLEMGEPARPGARADSPARPDLETAGAPVGPKHPISPPKLVPIPGLEMSSPSQPAPAPSKPAIPDLQMADPAPARPQSPSRLSESGQFPLEFGDFAHRIPTHLLRDTPELARIPFPIDVAEIAECVASGQTTLLLSEIRRRLPAVFQGGIPAGEDVPILYPWQKIGRLIKEASAGATSETNLLQELVRATAEARAARANPPSAPARLPTAQVPAPEVMDPLPGAGLEPALESRLAAMRESQARQLARIQAEREALLSRLTTDAGRARDEMRKDYEGRLAKTALARDQAQAMVAKLEAEKIKVMAEAQAVADREVGDTVPKLEQQVQQLQAKVAAMQEEHEAVLASKENLLEWNSRSIADLEEEVKTYRARIKAVLAERDALAREKADLTARLEEASATPAIVPFPAPSSEGPARADNAGDALQEKITKIMAANGEFIRALGSLSSANEELIRALEEQKTEG